VQGDGLQTGFRPSKGGNEAMPTHIFSETGSDYIVQARDDSCRPHLGERIATPVCALVRNDKFFGWLKYRLYEKSEPCSIHRINLQVC